jgi:hypothetical protein
MGRGGVRLDVGGSPGMWLCTARAPRAVRADTRVPGTHEEPTKVPSARNAKTYVGQVVVVAPHLYGIYGTA